MTTMVLSAGIAMAVAFAAGGLAVGSVYFAALRCTVDVYATGRGRLVPVALTLARIAGVTVFLGFAVSFGALSLLAAFLGFLLARSLALRAARRTV
jgi:hypothetical protein